ncbi:MULTISPECIES: GNAT family N-acetyltransferase [Actinomadura]|uniref:GNAT family N-acetyltransferase n=1 Tax=Actinomadura yumaensis TaxID=111807 RepID=A0ABW2CGT0_9ACTN|nr:GNAT family N-acetyltransferase [Actinomadura sp. J1-007]MWK35833.1 GNAT family N-acetyltransferase [Actinomadura sp. J1-007]
MEAIRRARLDDHAAIIAALPAWWGDSRTPDEARELSLLLPRLFLEHFAGTSLVADGPDGVEGFLVGFHSADRADEAYIHFVGVHPDRRKGGLARTLYERFFEEARAAGRTTVRAVTSPGNTGSIAFHRAMGFEASAPRADYDGPGQHRVCFRRAL